MSGRQEAMFFIVCWNEETNSCQWLYQWSVGMFEVLGSRGYCWGSLDAIGKRMLFVQDAVFL
jgi:hypothetical protein